VYNVINHSAIMKTTHTRWLHQIT